MQSLIGDDVTISLTEKDGGVVKNVESKTGCNYGFTTVLTVLTQTKL